MRFLLLDLARFCANPMMRRVAVGSFAGGGLVRAATATDLPNQGQAKFTT